MADDQDKTDESLAPTERADTNSDPIRAKSRATVKLVQEMMRELLADAPDASARLRDIPDEALKGRPQWHELKDVPDDAPILRTEEPPPDGVPKLMDIHQNELDTVQERLKVGMEVLVSTTDPYQFWPGRVISLDDDRLLWFIEYEGPGLI